MVFHGDVSDPAEDEFIYVNKDDKREDEEMQMITPILLDSMFDLRSPPDIFRVVKKNVDKADDATEVTTDSFSDLLLPSFDTPPAITTDGSYDDDASEMSDDSYQRADRYSPHHSPRQVMSPSRVIQYPFQIPPDVRYHGQVMFAVSPTAARHIHLQPRQSAQAQNIFVAKGIGDRDFYGDFALADSISSEENGHGAEECKDDDDDDVRGLDSYEEGFAYVYGDRFKEDDYWGVYDGHYGSRDFEDDARQNVDYDYADDHASVQEIPADASVKTPRYQTFGKASHDRSFIDDVQDLFAACFGCGVYYPGSPFSSRASPPPSPMRTTGTFTPADYGVSQSGDII